jgi:hypothetical protein
MPDIGNLFNSLSSYLPQIPGFLSVFIAIVTAVATISYVRSQGQAVLGSVRNVGLQQELVLIQKRRLAENNLEVQVKAEILYHHGAPPSNGNYRVGPATEPYLVATLDTSNIGDGPIDLLACLVAGRELSTKNDMGMGRQGRDVVWTRLVTYNWNDPFPPFDQSPTPLFRGLSTSKLVVYDPDHLMRLDAGEHQFLTRIDYLENLPKLYELGHVNLVYRIFTVVIGYPLDLFLSLNGDRKEAHGPLASPDFHRWARIQHALATINHFPFRLALEKLQDEKKQEGDATDYYAYDPLGRLADPIAWRCFLIFHEDFDERLRSEDTFTQLRKKLQSVQDGATETVYDPIHGLETRRKAQDVCRAELAHLMTVWEDLIKTIEYCSQPNMGFMRLVNGPDETRDTSKARLQALCRKRWERLRREGYLYRPHAAKAKPQGDQDDLDLRALWDIERFKMQTRYVIVTLKAPGHAHADQAPPPVVPTEP